VTRTGSVALPKAELHLHLEATIAAGTARELSDRAGLPVPPAGPFGTQAEFVVAYERARDLVASLDDVRRLAGELARRQVDDGVLWSEVHLIPGTYAGRLGPADGLVEAMLDGARSAVGDGHLGVVLGVNRRRSVPEAEHALDLALRWAGRGVVALGLAGDESHPASRFADTFARAAAHDLPTVPHAGEGAGAASVRDTLALSPTRICHGVRAVEDPALVELLVERQVCLDMAPSSNVLLGVVPDLASHPLPMLLRRGVPVTLNSDIPGFLGHGLAEEYARCSRAWRLSDSEVRTLAETSWRQALCPETLRRESLRQLAGGRSVTA